MKLSLNRCLHILALSSLQICSTNFSKSQFLAPYEAQLISLHWKRDTSYIELMICCQQKVFSSSPLKSLKGTQRNLKGSKISTSSTNFVFFWPIEKTRWTPRPLIGRNIFDFSSETKLTGARFHRPLPILCFSGRSKKARWPLRPLIGWVIFNFFLWNHWMEFNETW